MERYKSLVGVPLHEKLTVMQDRYSETRRIILYKDISMHPLASHKKMISTLEERMSDAIYS
jgi:hypothetical protein